MVAYVTLRATPWVQLLLRGVGNKLDGRLMGCDISLAYAANHLSLTRRLQNASAGQQSRVLQTVNSAICYVVGALCLLVVVACVRAFGYIVNVICLVLGPLSSQTYCITYIIWFMLRVFALLFCFRPNFYFWYFFFSYFSSLSAFDLLISFLSFFYIPSFNLSRHYDYFRPRGTFELQLRNWVVGLWSALFDVRGRVFTVFHL